MPDISIDKEDWASFLSWVTDNLSGGRAEIDVLSLDIGAQVEARSLPLLGVAYDRKSDVIEVALDGLDHLIHRPREVWASDADKDLMSIRVIDQDDVTQVIKLMKPLALPAPLAPPSWKREPAKNRMGKQG
ncbi:MAG TPA: DUF5335 family protein [Hyphomonadaceae bacterium]|nr:DUF5335 family protein [Hyphomonadaceae bacterium]